MKYVVEDDINKSYNVIDASKYDLDELVNLNRVCFPQDNETIELATEWIKDWLRESYNVNKRGRNYFYVMKPIREDEQPIVGYAVYRHEGGFRIKTGAVLELEQFCITMPENDDFKKFLLDNSIYRLDKDVINRLITPFANIKTTITKDRIELFLNRLVSPEGAEDLSNIDGTIAEIRNAYPNLIEERIDQYLLNIPRDTINKARRKNGVKALESYVNEIEQAHEIKKPLPRRQRRKLA